MVPRASVGLKRPGEDTGVLLEVRLGNCDGGGSMMLRGWGCEGRWRCGRGCCGSMAGIR